ncbi:MAG TPA: SDR family oxidoreductase [Cytophagales bacterium]|nr:SDR family oxidoreductase [Cytophagales bacterium]
MTLTLKKLKDQVIVITGATSGIGLVTARMAASKGAKLVLVGRNVEALQQLTNEIKRKGGYAVYVQADVGSEAEVNHVAEVAIRTYGTFDTWVNNAGVSIFGNCLEVSIEHMKRLFDTNFWGVVYGSRVAAMHYKQRKAAGTIVNVESFFADRSSVVQSTYSVSKQALHGWTDALRMELEKDKAPVSVCLIHSSRVEVPHKEHTTSHSAYKALPGGHIYAPEAVADAILHCAEHPKPDMYVGAQSKVIEVLGKLAPRLIDRLVEKVMYPTQTSRRSSHEVQDHTVLQERSTHKKLIRKQHYDSKASKPLLTTLLVAGIGAGMYLLSQKKKDTNLLASGKRLDRI